MVSTCSFSLIIHFVDMSRIALSKTRLEFCNSRKRPLTLLLLFFFFSGGEGGGWERGTGKNQSSRSKFFWSRVENEQTQSKSGQIGGKCTVSRNVLFFCFTIFVIIFSCQFASGFSFQLHVNSAPSVTLQCSGGLSFHAVH